MYVYATNPKPCPSVINVHNTYQGRSGTMEERMKTLITIVKTCDFELLTNLT